MSDEQKDLLSGLTKLGLTQYEAKVYSTLVTNGTCTAKDISNICGIPYGKTYEVINSLVNRGFVVVLPVKPMKYKPANCDETLKILQSNLSQELEHAKGVFNSLKERQKETEIREPRGSFWMLHGRSAINNKIENLIRKARKSIMLFLSGNAIYRIMYFRELLEQKKKDGIDISVITTKQSDDGICSMWSCSFCDDRNMNTKSSFVSVDGEESIIFESIPDDKNYTTGTDVGISILEKSTTSFLEAMFSVFNTHRHLLMSSANAIFILDAKTMEVIEANSQCSRLIGLDREALVGKNMKDIAKQLGVISPSFFDSCLRKLKKEKSLNIKNLDVTMGCKKVIANVSAYIQKFYGKDAIVVTVTDVTREKQVEQEKITISERYSHLFNTLPLPAILLSKDDKVLMANKAVEEEFGFKFGEKKDISIYNIIPKEKQGLMRKIRKISKNKTNVIKLPLITPKGIKNFIIFASKADSNGNKIIVGKDISELQDLKKDTKEAKKELKESEEKYKTIVESATDQIFMLDTKMRFISLNKTAANISHCSPEEMIGKSILDMFPKETVARFAKNNKEVIETGKSKFIEEKMVVNGREFYNNTVLNPIKDSKGNVVAVMGIVRDITEHKQAEEEVKKSNIHWRKTFDAMNDAICIMDVNNKFTRCNKAMETLVGKSEKDILGKKCYELLHKSDKPIKDCPILRMNESKKRETSEFETGVKILQITVDPIFNRDGSITESIHVIRDITELKKAEEEVKKEKEFSERMIQTADAIVVGLDKSHRIQLFNRGAEKITGYKKEEVMKKDWFKIFFRSEQLEEMNSAWYDAWGKGFHSHVNPIQTKNNEEKIISWSNSSIKDEHGNSILLLCLGQDITERRKAEEKLRESEEFLDNVIEKTPNPLWVSDEKGIVIRMNLALRDLLKITDEEIIGKYNVLKDSQVKEQGFLPLVTSVFEKGKTVNFTMDYDTGKEKQIKLGQKTCKMLNFVISPIKDPTGKVVNVICQHNDITEKEEAVKMLKAREEQYKLLIDNLPVAVAVTSIDGKFLSFNDAMLKMSSYTREELLNTPVMNLYCNPEERKKILQKLQKKEPIKDYEIEFRSRDGRIFHARVNMAPLKMGKEEVILTVVEDINKEKKANTGSVPGNPATG